MSVEYEWDVELVLTQDTDDAAEGDILEHRFQNSFADCLALVAREPALPDCKWSIVLVRDTDSMSADEYRTWAYLEDDGTLPEFFQGSGGDDQTKVPKRFHAEVVKAAARV